MGEPPVELRTLEPSGPPAELMPERPVELGERESDEPDDIAFRPPAVGGPPAELEESEGMEAAPAPAPPLEERSEESDCGFCTSQSLASIIARRCSPDSPASQRLEEEQRG